MPGGTTKSVRLWRQRTKIALVAIHGGKCLDCGYVGPPFMFDFDHRDPKLKSFGLSESGITREWYGVLLESLKCDLVCANCHRMRTHKQRCNGCVWCNNPL